MFYCFKTSIYSILAIFFTCISVSLFASHIKGGEFETTTISTLQIKVKLILYRNTSGVQQPTATVDFGDGTTQTITVSSISSISSNIERNEYIFLKTYLEASTYIISFTENFRSSNIININNGNSSETQFYIKAQITIDSLNLPNVNSLMFAESLFFTTNTNQEVNLYAGAYNDTDQNFKYKLITPKSDQNNNVPNYYFPDKITADNGQLTIDSTTGLITWKNPKMIGVYSLAVEIERFSNGYLVGQTTRDFTITVISYYPILATEEIQVNKTDSGGYYVQPNDSLVVNYKILRNKLLNLKISTSGELASKYNNVEVTIDSLSDSTGRIADSTTSQIATTIKIKLTPDSTLFRKNAYIMNIRYVLTDINGQVYNKDFAIEVFIRDPRVDYTTGFPNTFNIQNTGLVLYPNPTKGKLSIVNSNDSDIFHLFDLNGKQVKDFNLVKGQNSVNLEQLPFGIYFYKTRRTGGKILIEN